jgi:PAS domain S-box-containing protein
MGRPKTIRQSLSKPADKRVSWMQQVIDNLSDVAWVGDANGEIKYVSPSIHDLTGYFGSELLISGMELLFRRMRRNDVAGHRNAYRNLCAGDAMWEADVRFQRADDRWIWLHVRAHQPRGGDEPGIVYGTFADVTQRKATERKLRAARRAAEASDHAKSMLLANMSHELRTPMTGILGYAELLMTGEATSESERARWAQLIDGSGRRLLGLLNEILDHAKSESGVVEQAGDACSVREVIESEVALMTPIADAKGLALKVSDCATSLAVPPARVMQVRQIVTNLVGNAIKFTSQGEVEIRLRVDHGIDGDTVHIDVSDTGPGIDTADRDRIFEPFRRGRWQGGNRPAGTGLGLSISKRIARAMGGDLTLARTSSFGSTFTLSIPGQVLQSHSVHINIPVTRETPPLFTGSAFIVDDCAIASELAARYLNAENMTTRVSADAAEAVDAILEADANGRPFDVVLMDMSMPRLDGRQATTQLRAAGYRRPILAFTACLMAEERRACLAAGCDDIIAKPIMRDALLATVANAVRPALRRAA